MKRVSIRKVIISIVALLLIFLCASRAYTDISMKIEYPKIVNLSNTESFDDMEHIYIVLSHSGTFMSKIIRLCDDVDEYSHTSIGLSKDLQPMYSFARYKWFNAFYGGFKLECLDTDVFGRNKDAKLKVLEIKVTKEQKERLIAQLKKMYDNRDKLHYEYVGVLCANFDIYYRNKNNYYCSDFVKTMLINSGIIDKNDFPEVTKPEDFIKLEGARIIYEGYVKDYRVSN